MKTLGLCFALLLSISFAAAQESPSVPSPDRNKSSIFNPDKDAIQRWLENSWQSNRPWIGTVRRQAWTEDNLDVACATMRTYRVEREASGSDVTRSSGYTDCVPMARFRIESAIEPKIEPE